MTTIKLKNGSGAPLAGDLVVGEPALDLTNKRLYTEDSGGTVIEVGTNPTSLTTGTFTSTGIDDNAASTAITIDGSQNVGIGTSSPDVFSRSYTGTITGISSASGETALMINSSGTNVTALEMGRAGTRELMLYDTPTASQLFSLTSKPLAFGTASVERVRIDSSGNVGIGTSSPDYLLHLEKAGGVMAQLKATDSNQAYMKFVNSTTGDGAFTDGLLLGVDSDESVVLWNYEATATRFATGGTERMRIDSSGNLLVGKTSTGIGTVGAELKSTGELLATVNNDACAFLNRKSSDGDIAVFRKDDTSVGSIGVLSSRFYIGSGDTGIKFSGADDLISPIDASDGTGRDAAIDLGSSGARFKDIYATNGTIQTSDRNEKQDIETLSDAEQRVAVAAKGLLRKFRWIDAVEAKGDDARIHFGIIAQDLQDAFTAEGLDAGRYAMFISSTWWESTEVIPAVEAQEAVVDEEGNVVEEAVEAQEERTVVHTHQTAEEAPEGSVERTRLGVRYSELLAFIIAAI